MSSKAFSTARLATFAALWLAAATVANAQPAPYVEFLGDRFYVTKGPMPGTLGIGFDPANDEVQSEQLTDRCGNFVDAVDADNGIAWDYVNEEFWFINANRQVYHYVNGVKTTIFEIPQVFEVPGAGPDTLDSPQGLALDMNHVYVVDTGPNLGELESNAWFKFTRTGTPVSSSKLTDFHANLAPHLAEGTDVVVDGITWIPNFAPFGQGVFVAAVEHSGMQVLDANGMYVDRLLWSDAGLVVGESAPFAFAGIAVDPGRGDLYLVENSGVQTHVWIHLDSDVDQSIVHGVFGSVVHGPDSSCFRRLPLVPPLNFFSLTYRDVDGMLWTNEFNSGVAYTIDPKSGKHESQGFLGANDVWGMAYDPERDVIYCLEEDSVADYPIHVLDPNTMQSSALPNAPGFMQELAFNSDDDHIYGIGFDGGAVLRRVDRDTGISTIVGPTVGGSGIAYDRATGTLVTLGSGTLYDVDPATGNATIRATVAGPGWEGLAAIPVMSAATGAPVLASSSAISLRAYPNPSRGITHVTFENTRPGRVRARVLDVRGRVVRELSPVGPFDVGVHTLSWDGRANGAAVAPGVYFLEVRQGGARKTMKLTVVR